MKMILGKLALAGVLAASGIAHAADSPDSNLPSTVTGVASEGLVLLATTGNPEPLQKEIGGTIALSDQLEAKIGPKALAALLKLDRNEHLAPKSLIAPTGEWYNMVAPTITKDNFILVDRSGVARRMSVGAVAGDNRPTIVDQVREDGGTAWYVEAWYWVRARLTGK